MQTQMIEVSKLKPHPRNLEFFDNITGEKWKELLNSILRRGVVEPIVVYRDPITNELIIVSGNQRVRASSELKFLEIPCRIVEYPDFDENTGTSREDMILEDLICTNIMQRGIGNVNSMKMAKCVIELERIYGIKKGGSGYYGNQFDKKGLPNNSVTPKTQEDLAKQLGISVDTLQNYKKLTELIPEFQSLVETGALKSTTAYKIYAKLPKEEQEELFNKIGKEKIKQLTQKQTEEEINKIKKQKEELESTNKHLEESFNELSDKYSSLEEKLEQEKNKVPKTIQIDNTDYETMEKLKKELEHKEKLYSLAKEKEETYKNQIQLYEKDSQQYKDLKRQIELLTKEKDDIGRAVESATELSGYIYEIETFLKTKLAPIKYSRSLIDMKDNSTVIKNIEDIVECVEKWCMEIREQLPKKYKNIININNYDVEEI